MNRREAITIGAAGIASTLLPAKISEASEPEMDLTYQSIPPFECKIGMKYFAVKCHEVKVGNIANAIDQVTVLDVVDSSTYGIWVKNDKDYRFYVEKPFPTREDAIKFAIHWAKWERNDWENRIEQLKRCLD